jgi:broad specificity phosphatase PhoE
MPSVRPEVSAELWELDEQGRAAARALSTAVPGRAYYVASDEPKALQTLQEMAAGQEVVPEPAFREVRRPYRWSDDYREQARAYIDGVCHEGWEPHDQVIARFGNAVARHADVAVSRPDRPATTRTGNRWARWRLVAVAREHVARRAGRRTGPAS